jgi:hypothetical protein
VATSEASGVRSRGLIAQTDDIVATDRNMLVAGELDFDPRSALRARILFGEGGANGSSRPIPARRLLQIDAAKGTFESN